MKEILLSGSSWKGANDFYDAFFEAVEAPEWHGRNLDALNDSIGGGSINHVDVPYSIRITGIKSMSPDAQAFLERFRSLISDLISEGIEVELVCEE